MKNYAYLDRYGVMHVVDRLDVARDNAASKIVETEIANKGGYPCITQEVVIYNVNEAYVDGNRREGKRLRSGEYKEIEALYKALKED